MNWSLLLGFSFSQWWYEVSTEFMKYFNNMNETQWMVISGCAVLFGFLCLRGTMIKTV
jgi:hypothetical protein